MKNVMKRAWGCDAGDRDFIQVINGQVEYIDYSDVMEQVA